MHQHVALNRVADTVGKSTTGKSSLAVFPPLAMGWVYSSLLPQGQLLILEFLCTAPGEAAGQPLLNQKLTKMSPKQSAKDPRPPEALAPPSSSSPGVTFSKDPTKGGPGSSVASHFTSQARDQKHHPPGSSLSVIPPLTQPLFLGTPSGFVTHKLTEILQGTAL